MIGIWLAEVIWRKCLLAHQLLGEVEHLYFQLTYLLLKTFKLLINRPAWLIRGGSLKLNGAGQRSLGCLCALFRRIDSGILSVRSVNCVANGEGLCGGSEESKLG